MKINKQGKNFISNFHGTILTRLINENYKFAFLITQDISNKILFSIPSIENAQENQI